MWEALKDQAFDSAIPSRVKSTALAQIESKNCRPDPDRFPRSEHLRVQRLRRLVRLLVQELFAGPDRLVAGSRSGSGLLWQHRWQSVRAQLVGIPIHRDSEWIIGSCLPSPRIDKNRSRAFLSDEPAKRKNRTNRKPDARFQFYPGFSFSRVSTRSGSDGIEKVL